MKRLILGSLATALALVGCTSGNQPVPTPQTPVRVTPTGAPATHASVPASGQESGPAPTPTVDPSALPSVKGWSQRPQTVDPEAPSADTAWASERDVDDIMAIWASYACAEGSSLPAPRRVLEGSFHTEEGYAAIVEVATFNSGADAKAFRRRYLTGSQDCGATRITDDALTRPIDGSTWTEVLILAGGSMKLVVVEHKLDPAGVAVLISQIA